MTTTLLKRTICTALLAAGLATTAEAQYAPTPEGTTITNTASATYTDARGNTYAGLASNAVTITVGHYAALTNAGTSATPAEGSAGNWASFTLTNIGNGLDRFEVAGATTNDAANITLTGNYRIGSGASQTLAQLNAALGLLAQSAVNGTVEVQVEYDVMTASGTDHVQLEAYSDRTGSGAVAPARATGTALVATGAGSYAVSVTAAAATVNKVAGGTYTASFSVENTSTSNGTKNWDLGVTATNGAVTFSSVSLSSAQVSLAKGASTTVTVTYTIANNVTDPTIVGAVVPITVTATRSGGSETDGGTTTVTVVNPTSLAIVKAVTLDNGDPVPATVVPGTILKYTVTVTAAAGEAVTDVAITDNLHADLVLIDAVNAAGSNFVIDTSTPGVVAAAIDGDTATPALAAGAAKSIIIRVTLKVPTP